VRIWGYFSDEAKQAVLNAEWIDGSTRTPGPSSWLCCPLGLALYIDKLPYVGLYAGKPTAEFVASALALGLDIPEAAQIRAEAERFITLWDSTVIRPEYLHWVLNEDNQDSAVVVQ
jgi:hypothetical protein